MHPKQWKVPLSIKGDSVTKVSFSNKKTRLFVDNITYLIDYVFSSIEVVELKGIWRKMINDYSDAMKIIRKCSEYSAEDTTTFQRKIDDFLTAYVEASGAYAWQRAPCILYENSWKPL
jgi:hypothetical protein